MSADVTMQVRLYLLSKELLFCGRHEVDQMYLTKQSDEKDKMNEWVRLTSTDGYDYLVRRKVAMCSGTLKNMLSSESRYQRLPINPLTRHRN